MHQKSSNVKLKHSSGNCEREGVVNHAATSADETTFLFTSLGIELQGQSTVNTCSLCRRISKQQPC